MIAVFAVLIIPSYISFNRNQEVKQSGLYLKSVVRDAQNRSQSGEKDSSSCSSALVGFYSQFTAGSSDFSVGGNCGTNDFDEKTYTLPSKNVTIVSFFNASSYPASACTALSVTNSLRILYKTISHGVDFYDWNTQLGTGNILAVTKVGISVTDTSGNMYVVIIGNNGEIYDVPSC